MKERLPWFKCYPSKLIGAMAAMQPDEGYLYVTILLRIYETGGAIKDTAKILSRRTGMTERRVLSVIGSLVEMGKITVSDGLIDSESTHEVLAASEEVSNAAKRAGKQSALVRVGKSEQNQQNIETSVDPALNARSTTKTKIKDIDKREDSSSLRSDAPQLRLIEPDHSDPFRQNLKPGRQISTDPKTDFYRRGEELLGKNQGGFLRKVLTAKEDNISLARAALEMAATKPDPKRYLGGVINSNREIHSNQHLRDSGAAW